MKENFSIEANVHVELHDDNFTYDEVIVKVSATDSMFNVSLKSELVTLSDEAACAIEKTFSLIFDNHLLDVLKCFPHAYNELKEHFAEN